MSDGHENRREFSAIPVVGVVAVVGLAVLAGVSLGVAAGIIVFTGGAILTIVAVFVLGTRQEHTHAPDAPHVAPRADGLFRILVVADESCTTPAFVDELKAHAAGRPASVFLVAPALESRLGLWTDDQKGYDAATSRMWETLGVLQEAGFEVDGEVGPNDPLQAADDGLRRFPANEIVFLTHPAGEANWLEEGVVAAAEARYDQPVKHVTVRSG